MIYKFTYKYKKYVYDTSSGIIEPISALDEYILDIAEMPILPSCPMSLRYELAKYDSDDVNEAYEHIYNLFRSGKLSKKDEIKTYPVMRILCCYDVLLTDACISAVFNFIQKKEIKIKLENTPSLTDNTDEIIRIISSRAEEVGIKIDFI